LGKVNQFKNMLSISKQLQFTDSGIGKEKDKQVVNFYIPNQELVGNSNKVALPCKACILHGHNDNG